MRMNNFHILSALALVLAPILVSPGLQAQEIRAFIPQQDMSFETYLNRVGKQNLEYLASQMGVSIAEDEIIAARVLPDPSLDFEATRETYTLGLSYSLELGKRHARVNLAKSQAELEELVFEQNFQELRAGAAELFLDAILQRELLKAKQESYFYMLQLNHSDSLRFLSGEITENEYRQSRLEAISLLNEVYDQEAAYRSSLVDLNQYMGMPADTLNIPQGNWDNLKRDFTLSQLLEIGLNERLELLAASKNVEVRTKNYKLVRAERRPDIDLSLSYERDWNGIQPQMRYAKANVSVPLSFSSINKGAVRSAQYGITQASLIEQETALRVQSEITQAWFAFEAEGKKVAQYQGGVLEESRKVLDGMVYKYKRGETNILDVLIARRSYNEIQQGYLETMTGYASSLVALEKSCGIWDIYF